MLVRVVFRYRKGHIKLRIIIKWPAISLLYSILPTVGPNVRKHTRQIQPRRRQYPRHLRTALRMTFWLFVASASDMAGMSSTETELVSVPGKK